MVLINLYHLYLYSSLIMSDSEEFVVVSMDGWEENLIVVEDKPNIE